MAVIMKIIICHTIYTNINHSVLIMPSKSHTSDWLIKSHVIFQLSLMSILCFTHQHMFL